MTPNEQQAYRRNLTKAYAFKFLTMLHFFAGVAIPFFTVWGGIKFSQVMILQAFYTIIIFIFEVPTGAIADRFGRKTSLVLAGLVTGIASLVYGSYPNFWVFMLGEALWGIGVALISGAEQAMVYDSLKELGEENRSKKILGRWQSLGSVAIMIAAPIGSLVAKYIGLRWTIIFMAIPFFAASFLALTFKEPEVGRKDKTTTYFKTMIEGGRYLKDHKILQILAFDFISISALSFFIVWIYQVVLGRLNVPIQWFGFVCAMMTILEVMVLNNFSKLERLFGGKRNYTFITALIIGVSFIIMGVTKNVVLAIIVISLIAAFGLTRGTLFQNYMNKHIESHNRATVLSLISMLYNFSLALLNVIWGYMVDWNMTVTLVLIGSMTIVLALFSRVEESYLLD